MGNHCDKCRELRVVDVNAHMRHEVKNISANKGVTISKDLAPLIDQILSQYPDDMKNHKRTTCDKSGEIRIRGVSAAKKKQLENVAHNLNVDVSDLFKLKLYEYSKDTDRHLKREREEDAA